MANGGMDKVIKLSDALRSPGSSVVLDWYEPREITFKSEHVCWLLDNIRTLHSGCYPTLAATLPETLRAMGFADAPFVNPVLFYSELITRLAMCGVDGMILLIREGLQISEDEIAEFLNQPMWQVQKRAETALRYVSGKGRKWMQHGKWQPISYNEFKNYHRREQNPAV